MARGPIESNILKKINIKLCEGGGGGRNHPKNSQ